MQIDLAKGHIDAYNFKLTSARIFMNAKPAGWELTEDKNINARPTENNCYIYITDGTTTTIGDQNYWNSIFNIGTLRVDAKTRYSIGGISITKDGIGTPRTVLTADEAEKSSYNATMIPSDGKVNV
jgi:hypothetical protein